MLLNLLGVTSAGRSEVMTQEQRNYPRLNTALKVQDLATLKTGLTDNMSMGGCFIAKSPEFDALAIPSRIALKFEIPGINDTVVVFGLVKHVGQHGEGFGIQFQEVHRKSAYYIGNFMGNFL